MNKIVKAITKPSYALQLILHLLSPLIKDDEKYVKIKYRLAMGKKLDLENPQTYNEKLQWLKLHDHHLEYSRMVDKYEAKQYVADIIGEEYIIPTLGIYDSFDEIDFNQLPDRFVLKCTHNSGGIVICKNKKSFNKESARRFLTKYLHKNPFWSNREYPYKNVAPRIIAEKFMVDESGTELKDYKFFCFDGKCKMLFVATDRPHDTKFDFYDLDFNHLPFTNGHPCSTKEIKKPSHFEDMIKIAERLSMGMAHVRVDLYNINGHIYFGELTFFHWSGTMPFDPEEWDYKIGEWLRLPIEKDSNSH